MQTRRLRSGAPRRPLQVDHRRRTAFVGVRRPRRGQAYDIGLYLPSGSHSGGRRGRCFEERFGGITALVQPISSRRGTLAMMADINSEFNIQVTDGAVIRPHVLSDNAAGARARVGLFCGIRI